MFATGVAEGLMVVPDDQYGYGMLVWHNHGVYRFCGDWCVLQATANVNDTVQQDRAKISKPAAHFDLFARP